MPDLETLMAALGLRPGFEAVYSSALIGYEKPNPHAFRHVLSASGSSGPMWMIGDNPIADITGAAAVGIPGILVRSDADGAHVSCADLTDIRALINGRSDLLRSE